MKKEEEETEVKLEETKAGEEAIEEEVDTKSPED